ncbi:hypothetical protein DASC09_024330 [Saccharomycopsis crataegensis]|uniref:Uncharacterized protein n=1 Tax=Saccharomycopsis crataegensis TaxID=43959 RepID=A0AAV5QJZ9_9ASCO|nr:hypothetical protein DASC09_024330 [Saccharomycopsis crataegensis]
MLELSFNKVIDQIVSSGKVESVKISDLSKLLELAASITSHNESYSVIIYGSYYRICIQSTLDFCMELWPVIENQNPNNRFFVKSLPGLIIRKFSNILLEKIGTQKRYRAFAGRIKIFISKCYQINDHFVVNPSGEINADFEEKYDINYYNRFSDKYYRQIYNNFKRLQRIVSNPFKYADHDDVTLVFEYWIEYLVKMLCKSTSTQIMSGELLIKEKMNWYNKISERYDGMYFLNDFNPKFIELILSDPKSAKALLFEIFLVCHLYNITHMQIKGHLNDFLLENDRSKFDSNVAKDIFQGFKFSNGSRNEEICNLMGLIDHKFYESE